MTTSTAPVSIAAQIKGICDILRRSNCAGAMKYIPELTWLLFLNILDQQEALEAEESEILGRAFSPSLRYPYRWQDWASKEGQKRQELEAGSLGELFNFVNNELLPRLRVLRERDDATVRQKVIGEILSIVERVQVDTERKFLDVLDAVSSIKLSGAEITQNSTLSHAYEGLLLKMGEKNNDGGQFFTPRDVIKVIVETVKPRLGETVFDPACGTGGFLAQSYHFMRDGLGLNATGEQLAQLATETFYGKEKENLLSPIVLANLMLNGINRPNIWHGNTLTDNEIYGGLYQGAPNIFDVIMMNPPFGSKEGSEARVKYTYKTSSTQILFLQEVINSLKFGGRAGIVVDEGLLFRTNENAFVQTKRWLLDECDLYCIVSLPGGVFTQAGAGVKTNLLFFNKGKKTEQVWYYDLSYLKVNKGNPLTRAHFDDFFRLLPGREDSENSWTVTREEIEAKNYDLKAVNPNRKEIVDTRTPSEILDLIEKNNRELQDALAELRAL